MEGESYDVDQGDAGVMTYDVYACRRLQGPHRWQESAMPTPGIAVLTVNVPNCTNNNAVGGENESGHVCMSTGRWIDKCEDADCEAGTICDMDVTSDNFNYCVDLLTALRHQW